jgi:hypothetical protein
VRRCGSRRQGKDTRGISRARRGGAALPGAIIAPVSPLLTAGPALLPELVAALPREFGPYVTLMLLGFVLGILGHLFRSRWLVAIGLMLIVIGAFLLPLVLKATTNDEPPPPPRVTAWAGG